MMTIEWKKQAAAQGQSLADIEKAFLDSAYQSVQAKAAPIMKAPYRVGFEIVHHNDDNTRLVGIFVFRVNKDLYFAPVFFINGNIKGTDLFYRHSTKSFVPLNERWLEYLISRSETSEGHGVPISERTNTRRQLNLTSIVAPPTTMSSNYKYASIEVPDAAQVTRLAHQAWDEIKQAAIPALPAESLLRRFIVQDGGFHAIRKIASTCQYDRDFAEALLTSSRPENYMPDISPEKQAAPAPVLQLHCNVLHNPACKSASADDLLKGYVFEDKRATEDVNAVIHDIGERSLESVTQPGVHRVLVADGSSREMICGYHRKMFERRTIVMNSDASAYPVQTSGYVMPFTLIDTGDRKSIDLDILPSAKTWRVLGVFVKQLDAELGSAKPESGKLYRVLDTKTNSVSEPVYVKSVKPDELGLVEVEFYGEYCSMPKHVRLNPDYDKSEPESKILGKHCVWVEVAELKDGGPGICHCADANIALGDAHAIDKFIFSNGFAKAAVQKQGLDFVVRLHAERSNDPGYVLPELGTKAALMAHCALVEADADHILKQAREKGRSIFLYEPAERLAAKSAHNLRFPQFPEFYDQMNSDFNVLEQPQPTHQMVMADKDVPYVEKHRIGDKATFAAGDNLDTQSPMQLYELSQQRGVGSLFEHGVVGSLVHTFDSAALIETYSPDLLAGLDRIGRILFLFYWKPEDFAQAFGSDDQSQLENKLVSNFKSFGDLVIELLQKTKQRQEGSVGLA